MSRRTRKGAVLALVIVSALVLAILGVGLLFLIMQLGGGQELQHATDAGNLNVAKQVLRRPGTRLQGGDENNQFGDSVDLDTGEVNLMTYNRLAAEAFLVASNAQTLATSNANTHSQEMMAVVRGVADRLNTKLNASGNFDDHFGNVAQNHAMRMFESTSNSVQHLGSQHETSLMARGKASNVYIKDNQILPGAPSLSPFTATGKDGRTYLAGYKQLASVGSESLWAVPLRPALPPHLVSRKTFKEKQVRDTIPNFVPPNAYRSAGLAFDKVASAQSTRAVSHSIVGSLEDIYGAQIKRGVIVVDNTGSLNGIQAPGGFDIWQDKLMDPNFVEVAGNNANTGIVADQSSGNSPTLGDVKTFVDNNYGPLSSGDPAAQSNLANLLSNAGIDSWGNFGSNPNANAADQSFIDFIKNNGVSRCSNGSPSHSASPTVMTSSGGQPCNLEKFSGLYGQPTSPGSGNNTVNNLMAVEKFHIDICRERASGSECATIQAVADNTGLKQYRTNDCGLTQVREGTLRELLAQTNATGIIDQLSSYLRQMNPEATNGDINSVLNTRVAFNRVSYIYCDPTTTPPRLVLSTSVPPWPLPDLNNPSLNLPDGSTSTYRRAPSPFRLDGITNCDGECGYPHPWDCPLDSQATGQDSTNWTPSSGFRSILGVIKFRNQAAGGGRFCCPC